MLSIRYRNSGIPQPQNDQKKNEQATEKMLKQRDHVMNELINTEEKYLKDIEIFVTHYVTPLRTTKFPEIESHTQAYLTV